jgi:hypothetical protein
VSKSRVLRQLTTNFTDAHPDAGKRMHEAAVVVCKRSIRVVKEIRFSRGVPDPIMFSEVKVLHLVRDPRAILYSRLALEAFCGTKDQTRGCIQPLCQSYRATLRGIASYLATLEGRPFWQVREACLVSFSCRILFFSWIVQFYKFKRVKFEEVASDPIAWTQRIYAWAGLGSMPSFVGKWVTENTQAKKSDGPYSTKRDASEVIDKWRGEKSEFNGGSSKEKGLTLEQVREVNQECGDILHQLNYSNASELLPPWQTTPGTSVGGRVVPREDISIMATYPRELIHNHWVRRVFPCSLSA